MRLVSFDDKSKDFYREAGYHYLRDGKDTKAVLCLRLTFGEPCFFCDVVSALYKTKDKKDKEVAKDLSASARIFFNAIHKDDEDKVKILAVGNQIFTQILGYIADEDWGDITHRKHGHDIVIEKVKKGEKKFDIEYKVRPKPKSTSVDVSDDELFDLESILEIPTYEEQQAMYEGDVEKLKAIKDEKDSVDSKELKRTSRTATKKKDVGDEIEIERLMEKLDLTDSVVAGAFKKWKKKGSSLSGLRQLVDLFGEGESEVEPETGTEMPDSEPKDDLDLEIEKALAKYKKVAKGKK